MTAGPLTLEDLERLAAFWQELAAHPRPHIIHSADASRVVAALAALRSVMAERDEARKSVAEVCAENSKTVGRLSEVLDERDEAREQVRSLTVERDVAIGQAESWAREWEAARARLSRAREALDTVSCALDAARAFLPPIVETRDYVAADQALDDALAGLRAALAEPPAGGGA